MNYRHDFHAANFADVFKHIALTRILLYLAKKEAPFRYIDTHAGSGFYDLSGAQAQRTSEWRMGLERLARFPLSAVSPAGELIAPYLHLVKAATDPPAGAPRLYPGSPAIAARLLRRQDRLLLCELHPAAAEGLRTHLGGDRRLKIIEMDGLTGLNAFVPPVERRGLALIDPAFEDKDDLKRSLQILISAWRKWSTGIYVLWYPVKDRREIEMSFRVVAAAGMKHVLRVELQVAPPLPEGPLRSNGLLIVNPPFPLKAEMDIILPVLAEAMGDTPGCSHRIDWLAGE